MFMLSILPTTVYPHVLLRSILFAAMDTTSNTMSRTLHLQHPDVQEKLRHEVVEVRAHGNLDYDQVHALPYLDAVSSANRPGY